MKDAVIAVRSLNPERIESRLAEFNSVTLDIGSGQRGTQTLILMLIALVLLVGIVAAVV